MKKISVFVLSFISFNIATAAVTAEVIGAGPCNGVEVDDNWNRLDYLVNDQGQVKIDVQMENSLNSDSVGYDTDSYRTPVVSNLMARENIITHIPTGVVCAVYKKAAIIGGKSWVDRSACKIVTKETRQKTYDQDGFFVGKSCVREYSLQVKIKN